MAALEIGPVQLELPERMLAPKSLHFYYVLVEVVAFFMFSSPSMAGSLQNYLTEKTKKKIVLVLQGKEWEQGDKTIVV